MGNDKITMDAISRAELHKLVIDLQKQVDELRATIGTFDKRTDYTGIGGVKIS